MSINVRKAASLAWLFVMLPLGLAHAATQEQTLGDRILGRSAQDSLSFLFNTPEDVELTPEQAQALPYAANYARIGDGARSLIVLGENDNVTANGQILGLKQQWFSNENEVLETYNAKVVSLQNLSHAQVKQLWVSRTANTATANESDNANIYNVDVRVPSPYHTEHKPHYMTKRHSYKITALGQRTEPRETQTITLPNGRKLNAVATYEVLFQNGEPQATNEFLSDPATGRIVHSKQWLGPELGYLEFTEVQPYNGGAASTQNWAFSPVAANQGFQQLTTTDGSNPLQYIEVRVVSSATPTNVPTKHTGLFYANSRLNQAITEYHRNGVQQPYYEPLTRLSSAKLEQQFEARKQGMITKLALLEQTYKHDGETELAAQASKLAIQFQHWPLKASFIHGSSLANARLDLAQNPVLNTEDAMLNSSHIPYYELRLASAAQSTTQAVGLTNPNPEYVYVIDAFGEITKVPMQNYNGNAAIRAIAQQPGAVVLTSIADDDLPKGFRDLNLQLAQFLRHWNWAHKPTGTVVVN